MEGKFNAKTQRLKDRREFLGGKNFATIQNRLTSPDRRFRHKTMGDGKFRPCRRISDEKGFSVVALPREKSAKFWKISNKIRAFPIVIFDDLTLPEITALASKAKIFVGNDSGIAHIAAAVNTPSVVIFGSSNINHWRPWTNAPNEIVYEKFHCQPCAGHFCAEFGEPECILSVKTETVIEAIEKILVDESDVEKIK